MVRSFRGRESDPSRRKMEKVPRGRESTFSRAKVNGKEATTIRLAKHKKGVSLTDRRKIGLLSVT